MPGRSAAGRSLQPGAHAALVVAGSVGRLGRLPVLILHGPDEGVLMLAKAVPGGAPVVDDAFHVSELPLGYLQPRMQGPKSLNEPNAWERFGFRLTARGLGPPASTLDRPAFIR